MLAEREIGSLISYLSVNPKAGDLIEGAGGVRKLRWAREGMGKRGGVRIIYCFHSERMPLYLLTLFAKNERSDLSMAERTFLASLVKRLVAASG